jgi:NADPH-dependent 2,4-dienoyl-CoA reductase/sulfur reductase-like enzyme/rhodanese-related sulfurtransferase
MKEVPIQRDNTADRIVIIGAVSLGPKVASRIKRLKPDCHITLLDQDDLVSYAACGIPYYVSGDITEEYGLRETNFKVRRDQQYYSQIKQVDLRTRTRALAIDRSRQVVQVRDLESGLDSELPYDKLVIATGKRARGLAVPGEDLANVHHVYNLKNAIAIRDEIAKAAERVVIVGGGFSGVEMCEAMRVMWGVETTLLEVQDQVLPHYVDPNIAKMVEHHLCSNGVNIGLGETVLRLEGQGRVERVVTDRRTIETDMVILANGVVPNVELARDAGLAVSEQGRIAVNAFMQTSDPRIFAGGDCVEIENLITGKPDWFPLNSLAQRQGRTIGTNLAGERAEFKGAVGNYVVKIFDQSLACAGLNLKRARAEGFDAIGVMVAQLDHAHFWIEKNVMFIELVVDRTNGRVLGIQALGAKGEGASSRVNAVASILKDRPSVKDIANLEISYSPPFAAPMDVLNTAGNVAENVLLRRNQSMDAGGFRKIWENIDSGEWLIVDTRTATEAAAFLKRFPDYWVNIPMAELFSRSHQLPRDKKLLVLCKTGLRSYECHSMLSHLGFAETFNLDGGIVQLEMGGLSLDGCSRPEKQPPK